MVRGHARPGIRTLADLPDGAESTIVRINGNGALRQRLLDLGVTRGARVRVERRAPLGDPIEIAVKDSLLAIRHAEAAQIQIEDT